jgi:hypothetical protein
LAAYRAIGGLPYVPFGEDRALVAAVERAGLRVRHDPDVRVITSGRLIGRAAGGVADTIRLRCEDPDAFCDAYLEPAWIAWRRATARRRIRWSFEANRRISDAQLFRLALSPQSVAAFRNAKNFQDALQIVDANSPLLARVLLRPSQLSREILAARRIVRYLRAGDLKSAGRDRDDSPLSVAAE